MAPVIQMPPLVSIVTPVYNHERFIAQCIESVLAQTAQDWEMILVDDGSTDGSAEIIRSYRDERIKLIQQSNRGIARLGETYNTALAASRGELIAILEGDDYWPKYKLEVQLPDFEDPVVVLSSGITAIVDSQGSFITVTPSLRMSEQAATNRPVGIALKTMLSHEGLTYTFPVSTILRREALMRAGGFTQPAGMSLVDLPTFIRISLEGEFRFHYDVCGVWRRHESSTTKQKFPEILESCYQEVFDFIRGYRSRIPMTDQELDVLDLKWQYFMVQLCTLRGRMLASQREWALSARSYREGLSYRHSRKGDVAMRLGALMSGLHLPSEWIFKASGRPGWREATVQTSGDWLVAPEDMKRKRPVTGWRDA